MKSLLKLNFDAICSYHDWCVFTFADKNYVVDYENEYINEVKLVNKMPLEEYCAKHPNNNHVIDFGDAYCGESDDGKWALGFEIVE